MDDSREYLELFLQTLDSATLPQIKQHPQDIALALVGTEDSRIWTQTQVREGVMDPPWRRPALATP